MLRTNTRWRLLLLCTILLAAIGGVVILSAIRGNSFKRRIAALHDAGMPVQIADLKLTDAAHSTDDAWTHLDGIRDEIVELHSALFHLPNPRPRDLFQMPPTVNADDFPRYQTLFAKYAELAESLERASDCSTYTPPLDCNGSVGALSTSICEQKDLIRCAVRILLARAKWRQAAGEPQHAADDSLTALKLALVCRVPTLLGRWGPCLDAYQSIQVLGENLAHPPVSADFRNAVDEALSKTESIELLRLPIIEHRAVVLSIYQELFEGRPFIAITYQRERSRLLELFDRQLESPDSSNDAIERIAKQYLERKPFYGNTPQIWNAHKTLMDIRRNRRRLLAIARCARLVNALSQHDIQNPTEKALNACKPQMDNLRDPYTDEVLVVHVEGGRLHVYSRGENERDDGGKVESGKDIGFEISLP